MNNMLIVIPDNIEKLKNSQYLRFMETEDNVFNVVGIGISEMSTSYNPQVDNEQWIIEDASRSDHTGNQKQSSVSQKPHKNDPVFEFVNSCRDKVNNTTRMLEIDTWTNNNGSYPAKLSGAKIVPTSYAGGTIEYDIYFEGDPIEGSVTFVEGKPTFVPNVSL